MSRRERADRIPLDSSDALESGALADGSLLRNLWYLAVPSARLKPGKTLARRILGEPVLLGRTSAGTVFALRDICPHRGVPLRYGKFDGREVSCRYHGWTFAPDGRCTGIPSLCGDHGVHLDRIRAETLPCREVQGNVWLFMADRERPQAPERAEIPTVPFDADATPRFTVSMRFPCHLDHVFYALFDPAHVAFVHRSWWWKSRRSNQPANFREKEKHFEPAVLGWRMARHAVPPESKLYRLLGRRVTSELVYRLPGMRVEEVRGDRHSVALATVVTPCGENESEVHNSFYTTAPWIKPLIPLVRRLAHTFTSQDRDISVKQAQGLPFNPKFMLVGDTDVQARWYLSLKREWILSQQERRPFRNPIQPRTLRWRS